jgi:hypothetical protein
MKAIRNFAIIAAMASFVVACGGKKEEATEATTDSGATEMPAEEAAPATDSAATTDSAAAPAAEAAPAEAPAAAH